MKKERGSGGEGEDEGKRREEGKRANEGGGKKEAKERGK